MYWPSLLVAGVWCCSCIVSAFRWAPTMSSCPQNRRAFLEAGGFAAVAVLAPTCAGAKTTRVKDGPKIALPSGVIYQDMTVGDGVIPREGDRVAIHYSLFCKGFQVESSRESSGLAARPLGFNYGTEAGPGSVPKGLQLGMEGMKVGGRRKITVPPELAFGEKGREPFIPPNTPVMFDVSLWSVKPKGTDPNFTFGRANSIF
ncbi:hypothetical protein JKP88DRAFT_270299 [Tribonema minus]|uniref:peptidylprolyl isomerase n=1 Tax=Tribonema minus TaxID=303371 RepID=A0A836CDH4_9STRA|nr:hypothetical protein JKP88DRAFT_270299 [Tribonema minus]